ncbi:hypothetical protein [uncultured Thiothrix sp.]|jgi:hypothetical protein|uniref:hypothetical protein n=1 Tax=uncultured Thiothrix sp. TaxID=223185 RepID=UPI002607EBF7|nr:hypothetical protein [uncultured Thiothrix sp.]HRJ94985.1 hypothetical protein [Candidatus Thiothrix moscowensis]
MSIEKAFDIHQEIKTYGDEVADNQHALKSNLIGQYAAAGTTWIIYLMFFAAMYAAPLWVLEKFFDKNGDNHIAVYLTTVFIIIAPTALSILKHVSYRALAKRDANNKWIAFVIGFLIVSGIYYEMVSATAQQQEKAFAAVDDSERGKNLSVAPTVTVDTSLAGDVAKASQKLAQCEQRMKQGKERHCEGDKAKLLALKDSQKTASAASIQAASATVAANQQALQQERDAHALTVAKMFAEFFAVGINSGASIAAFIGALLFEIAHAISVFNERALRGKIDGLNGHLNKLKGDYFKTSGKMFNAGDFKDDYQIDLGKLREAGELGGIPAAALSPTPVARFKWQDAGEAIATEFARAQHARNVVNDKTAEALGKVGGMIDKATLRESGGFKQSPKQLQRVHELAENHDLNHPIPTPHARVVGNSGQPHAADTPHAPLARVGVIEPGTDEALQAATDAPIGSKVGCPYCGSEFIKRNAQHKFCCKEHRFAWHNERDPAKQQFLKQRNMKG